MRRLVIILVVIGGLYFIVSKNTSKTEMTFVEPTPTEHAAVTRMALQAEAKAKQAAALASTLLRMSRRIIPKW